MNVSKLTARLKSINESKSKINESKSPLVISKDFPPGFKTQLSYVEAYYNGTKVFDKFSDIVLSFKGENVDFYSNRLNYSGNYQESKDNWPEKFFQVPDNFKKVETLSKSSDNDTITYEHNCYTGKYNNKNAVIYNVEYYNGKTMNNVSVLIMVVEQ